MSGVAAEPKKPVNKGDTATIKHILDGILVEVRARAIDPVPPRNRGGWPSCGFRAIPLPKPFGHAADASIAPLRRS